MPRSPRTATVVTLLVVTAALLPVVGVAAVAPDDASAVHSATETTGQNETTVRLHRVPNGTDPRDLPDHVGIDEPSDPVFLPGDGLVVTVQSRALAAELSNASGESLTERFVATQTNESRLWVVLTNPRPELEPTVFDLSDTANVTVVEGDAPATYHVVVDTGSVDLAYGQPWESDRSEPELRPDMEFYAGFDDFDRAETNGNRTIRVGEVDVEVPTGYGDEVRRLEPGPNATVTGVATLAPSTPITVEVLNASTGAVVASDRAVVERVDGGETTEFRFTARLNLTGEAGDGYELRVRSNRTGVVGPVPASIRPREASLSFRNDTTQWGTTVENATLTWGGFVVVHEAGSPETVVGVSDYVYPGTERESVGVQFSTAIEERTPLVAVAYRDVDRDGELSPADEPYREDGEPVTATAVVEPPEVTTTPPTTATTAPRDGTTTVTSTTGPTDTQTTRTLGLSGPTDGDGSVPGFGVAGTVAALLALCALVARRR